MNGDELKLVVKLKTPNPIAALSKNFALLEEFTRMFGQPKTSRDARTFTWKQDLTNFMFEALEPELKDYMRKVRHDFKLRKADLLQQARGLAPEADIVDLKLSGSYAAGNPTPESDVDLLIYFQGNASPEDVIGKLLGRLHSPLVGIFDVGAVRV